MVARNIHDTMKDRDMTRLRAHLDGPANDKGAKKIIEYQGAEVTVERTGPGTTRSDGRPLMKEVRTITKTKTYPTTVQTPWKPGQYERIFGHE